MIAIIERNEVNKNVLRLIHFCYLCFCLDPDCVNQVKQVYIDLNLHNVYSHYEEETYKNIKLQIEQFSRKHAFPEDILISTLDRTFNRTWQSENYLIKWLNIFAPNLFSV